MTNYKAENVWKYLLSHIIKLHFIPVSVAI